MIERFLGESGKRILIEALKSQKIFMGNSDLATEIADLVEIRPVAAGESIITQGGGDNDVYLILAGTFNVLVNGKVVAKRSVNDSVGEMAAIESSQPRSATVTALEPSVVAKLAEESLTKSARKHPEIYRHIAKELAKRLIQRNALVSSSREKIRVFIISSVESLGVARIVQNSFAYDPFTTSIWTDGVFKIANYTLQSLEDEIDNSDFAIAIAHADDLTSSRGESWPAPRDNVIFELGLFMGRLGKHRAILMEPRDEGIKLPSDLSGITTIPYRYAPGDDAAAMMGPACNALRSHILRLGPNN
jgi:CRP/FNR family cyclic AMP-dependent transcriptional regulator